MVTQVVRALKSYEEALEVALDVVVVNKSYVSSSSPERRAL